MRRTLAVFLFSLIVAAAGLLPAAAPPFAALPCRPAIRINPVDVEVVAPYVEVRRKTNASCGSGVALLIQGRIHVLTASHVTDTVSDDDDLFVIKGEGGQATTYRARVVLRESSYDCDLALLELWRGEKLAPARFDPRVRVRTGEPCYYIGTPRGIHASLEQSIINRPLMPINGQAFTITNGNCYFGNSGGPLYVKRHNHWVLAGICSRACQSFNVNPRTPVGFVPVVAIADFLPSHRTQKRR